MLTEEEVIVCQRQIYMGMLSEGGDCSDKARAGVSHSLIRVQMKEQVGLD